MKGWMASEQLPVARCLSAPSSDSCPQSNHPSWSIQERPYCQGGMCASRCTRHNQIVFHLCCLALNSCMTLEWIIPKFSATHPSQPAYSIIAYYSPTLLRKPFLDSWNVVYDSLKILVDIIGLPKLSPELERRNLRSAPEIIGRIV
jgi:hypothetical protein